MKAIFYFFLFQSCIMFSSCFSNSQYYNSRRFQSNDVVPRKSHTLLNEHTLYIDVFNNLKNVIIPHDACSMIAAESTNVFICQFLKKTIDKKYCFTNKIDFFLFLSCFCFGIPQTFNPIIIALINMDFKNNFKKETICAFVGISKWLIYNKLITFIGIETTSYLVNEHIILISSMIATLIAFSIKSTLVTIAKDIHYVETLNPNSFLEKEVTQNVVTEQLKDILKNINLLNNELPFANLLEFNN